MGLQIIQQPNGKFAIFSTVVDAFTVYDATEEEIIQEFGDKARQDAERRVRDIVAALRRGEKPYYQFTKSWPEASKSHRDHAPDSPIELES